MVVWWMWLAACGPAPFADDLPVGTACVRVADQELCAKTTDILGTHTGDGFEVEAVVAVPDRELGYDQATLRLAANRSGTSFAALVPLAVDCLKVEVHGDHCHPEVEVLLSCEVPLRPASGDVTVERLTDDRVYARFEGVYERERPPCCRNDCQWSVPPASDPSGPLRITGVVHAALD